MQEEGFLLLAPLFHHLSVFNTLTDECRVLTIILDYCGIGIKIVIPEKQDSWLLKLTSVLTEKQKSLKLKEWPTAKIGHSIDHFFHGRE